MLGKPKNPVKDPIEDTLKDLGAGPGYGVQKLLNASMLTLFPEEWPRTVRAASCDELIREYLPLIKEEKWLAATKVALNIDGEYGSGPAYVRLTAFRHRWQDERNEKVRLNFADDGAVYRSTCDWWYKGRDNLRNYIATEITRRNRTQDWPQPAQATLERVETAIRSIEPPTSDVNPEEHIASSAPSDEQHNSRRTKRRYLYMAALVGCLIAVLGVSLYLVPWPGQRAKGSTISYASTIEHRYDGKDPRGKDGPGTRCADPPPSQPVNQVHPPVIGPNGKVVGWIELRTSPICQVIWAKVHWNTKNHKQDSYTMPPGWALHIQMIRRVDPKMIQTVAYDTSAYVYGNMLATVSGCVYAKVFFANGAKQTPAATTPCTPSD